MYAGFDRNKVLYDSYHKEIESWDWKGIKQECENSEPYEDDMNDCIIHSCFLGSVFSIMPSGKYYMPWCTNQTKHDIEKDSAFYEALETIAERHGLFVFNGEGDPCDLFVGYSEDLS